MCTAHLHLINLLHVINLNMFIHFHNVSVTIQLNFSTYRTCLGVIIAQNLSVPRADKRSLARREKLCVPVGQFTHD